MHTSISIGINIALDKINKGKTLKSPELFFISPKAGKFTLCPKREKINQITAQIAHKTEKMGMNFTV